jgi:hypothetical protein
MQGVVARPILHQLPGGQVSRYRGVDSKVKTENLKVKRRKSVGKK